MLRDDLQRTDHYVFYEFYFDDETDPCSDDKEYFDVYFCFTHGVYDYYCCIAKHIFIRYDANTRNNKQIIPDKFNYKLTKKTIENKHKYLIDNDLMKYFIDYEKYLLKNDFESAF